MREVGRQIVSHEQADRLYDIMDSMLEKHGKTCKRPAPGFMGKIPPFDVSKPNEHDTKPDFEAELAHVQSADEHIEALLELLIGPSDSDAEGEQAALYRDFISQKARNLAGVRRPETAIDLHLRNAIEIGIATSAAYILIDLLRAYRERMNELRSQQEMFWNLGHKAPNYHARVIAFRLARFYVQETAQHPTVGTSGVTGEPSTDYTRALKEVFSELGIKANVRPYAEWAVEQNLSDATVESNNALARWRHPAEQLSHDVRLAEFLRTRKKKGS